MTPSERAYTHLLHLVAQQGDGSRLPSERDLAVDLGVSRQSVKGAFERLIAEGAVTRRVGSGTFVIRPGTKPGEPDAGLMDVIEMRRILEPGLVSHAISRATEDDFARIERAWQRMADATSSAAVKQAGYAITLEIARSTRNPLCVATFEMLLKARERLGWERMKGLSDTPDRQRLRIAQARALIDALRQRDRVLAVRLASEVVEQLVRDALALDAVETDDYAAGNSVT
jgi:GntR family transcriptional regulator, transcriptional repressor for pyruvate dehydrogenase complex